MSSSRPSSPNRRLQTIFGTLLADGSRQVTGPWQSALSCAATVGAISGAFGAFGNGYFTQHFGYRKVLLISLIAITAFIFLLFFATSLGMLDAGLILCGIPWGVFATMAPAYASEVCPLALRGYLTVYVNLCWAIGQLIAAGVLRGFVNGTDQWAYRIPFAIQWVWPIPLFIVLWFAPESPWWLVRRNRHVEAIRSIKRLSQATDATAVSTVALIVHTNSIEDEAETGTSYRDCFRGRGPAPYRDCLHGLRRTDLVWLLSGWHPGLLLRPGRLGSLGVLRLFSRRPRPGFGRHRSLVVPAGPYRPTHSLRLGPGSVGRAAAPCRKPCLGVLFGCQQLRSKRSGPSLDGFQLLDGRACLLRHHLRDCFVDLANKSICLSRASYYISQVIGNVTYPYMVNPTEGNWKGKAGYFWAGTCFLFFIWAFFRLPETRNRTFEEIDILFLERVKLRDFDNYQVDAYATSREERLKKIK